MPLLKNSRKYSVNNGKRPENAVEWSRMAKEEALRVSGMKSPLRLKEDLILPVNLVYQAV
jgi:hypothetical protein